MKNHPAHYFIKWLVLTEEDSSRERINQTLRLNGMAAVPEECFAQIRGELGTPPEWLKLYDRKCPRTRGWLRSQSIYSFCFPDEAVGDMSTHILGDAKARRTLEGLLLGNVSPGECSFRMRSQLKMRVPETAISEYQHYFWNTTLLSIGDWVEYFEIDSHAEEGSGRTSYGTDMYTTALHCGPNIAMYRAGIARELDGKKVLMEVQSELYATFKEVSVLPLSETKVRMLGSLSRGLAKIDERLQAGDEALHDVLKRFEKFRIHVDGGTVPKLIDLAPTGSTSTRTDASLLTSREN